MKMYLNPTSYRPKGVGKTVFDNLLGDPKDSKDSKKPKPKKKQKPWKDKDTGKK